MNFEFMHEFYVTLNLRFRYKDNLNFTHFAATLIYDVFITVQPCKPNVGPPRGPCVNVMHESGSTERGQEGILDSDGRLAGTRLPPGEEFALEIAQDVRKISCTETFLHKSASSPQIGQTFDIFLKKFRSEQQDTNQEYSRSVRPFVYSLNNDSSNGQLQVAALQSYQKANVMIKEANIHGQTSERVDSSADRAHFRIPSISLLPFSKSKKAKRNISTDGTTSEVDPIKYRLHRERYRELFKSYTVTSSTVDIAKAKVKFSDAISVKEYTNRKSCLSVLWNRFCLPSKSSEPKKVKATGSILVKKRIPVYSSPVEQPSRFVEIKKNDEDSDDDDFSFDELFGSMIFGKQYSKKSKHRKHLPHSSLASKRTRQDSMETVLNWSLDERPLSSPNTDSFGSVDPPLDMLATIEQINMEVSVSEKPDTDSGLVTTSKDSHFGKVCSWTQRCLPCCFCGRKKTPKVKRN